MNAWDNGDMSTGEQTDATNLAVMRADISHLLLEFRELRSDSMARLHSLEISRVELNAGLKSIAVSSDKIVEVLQEYRKDYKDLKDEVDRLKQWRSAGLAVGGVICALVGYFLSSPLKKLFGP